MFGRIGVAADRTDGDGALVPAGELLRVHLDLPDGNHLGAVLQNLPAQGVAVLVLLLRELEEPLPGQGEALELFRIDGSAPAFAGLLVVEAHSVDAEVHDLEPAIAEGAGREELHGVRQALSGLGDGVENASFGEPGPGRLHEEGAEQHAGRGVAVEGLGLLLKFLLCILAEHDSPPCLCLPGPAGAGLAGLLLSSAIVCQAKPESPCRGCFLPRRGLAVPRGGKRGFQPRI